jgi:hypothetical protein
VDNSLSRFLRKLDECALPHRCFFVCVRACRRSGGPLYRFCFGRPAHFSRGSALPSSQAAHSSSSSRAPSWLQQQTLFTEVRVRQFPQRKMGHMSNMQPTSGTLVLGRAAFALSPKRSKLPRGPLLRSPTVLCGMHPPVQGECIFLIIPRDRPYLAAGPGPLGPGLSALFTTATR